MLSSVVWHLYATTSVLVTMVASFHPGKDRETNFSLRLFWLYINCTGGRNVIISICAEPTQQLIRERTSELLAKE